MKLSVDVNVAELNDRQFAELAKEVFNRIADEPMYVTQRIMEEMVDVAADSFQGNVKQATAAIWG